MQHRLGELDEGAGKPARVARVDQVDHIEMVRRLHRRAHPQQPFFDHLALRFRVGRRFDFASIGGGDTTFNTQVAGVMKARNLKSSRMDLIWNGNQAAFRDQVQRIRANGGNVQAALQICYQWDNSCNPNLAAVEQDAYNQTYSTVNAMKDLVQDYELLNETQLRPEITREVPWNSAGTSIFSTFRNSTIFLRTPSTVCGKNTVGYCVKRAFPAHRTAAPMIEASRPIVEL